MPITEERLRELESYFDATGAIRELIATIRELQQSVSVPSEPLVSREEAAKIVAERGKELRRMANAPMMDNGAVTRLKGQAAICNELANTIRALPAVSVPVPQSATLNEFRSRLVRIAAAMIHGTNFLSHCAEDYKKPSIPARNIVSAAEAQHEQLRRWSIELRAIYDGLGTIAAPSPSEEA